VAVLSSAGGPIDAARDCIHSAVKGETGPIELRQDKGLPAALLAEAEGILAWLVRGCLEWQKNGLEIPGIVHTATDAYRHEYDLIAMFIDDMCQCRPLCRIRASDLYAAFKTWCEPLGESPVSMRAFGETIQQRGYEKKASNGVWYLGIGMRAETE
jgi:putative DNA primase/helicase